MEALALLQNTTVEDVDVIELLEANNVPHEQVAAVMARLHATSQPLPQINSMGILELSYEALLASGSTLDGEPIGAPLSPSSPLLQSALKETPSFWSEDSTEISVGAQRSRAPR